MSAIQGMSGAQSVTSLSADALDIETLLLSVQSDRARLLDTQLAQQIDLIKDRNAKVDKLNNLLTSLTDLSKLYGSTDGTAKLEDQKGWKDLSDTQKKEAKEKLDAALKETGLTMADLAGAQGAIDTNNMGKITLGQVTVAIEKTRGMIDSLNNTQQMETLRMQSLSNKRNEAYDLMTNFIKKMQDNRSGIISNMR
jgi:chromosome condensin MukBEF ATPase and DNA-binding subunit MukB